MQKHYREQGVAASEEGKAAFAEQLKTKLPAGAELTEDMLTGAFGMQLVESVPLLSGGPHTGWIHVNMYCDDKCVHPAACRDGERKRRLGVHIRDGAVHRLAATIASAPHGLLCAAEASWDRTARRGGSDEGGLSARGGCVVRGRRRGRGQMKSLPPNARAMGIAEACGKPTQVYGDVFMGRLYEDADDFVRLNFELKVRAAHPSLPSLVPPTLARLRGMQTMCLTTC